MSEQFNVCLDVYHVDDQIGVYRSAPCLNVADLGDLCRFCRYAEWNRQRLYRTEK